MRSHDATEVREVSRIFEMLRIFLCFQLAIYRLLVTPFTNYCATNTRVNIALWCPANRLCSCVLLGAASTLRFHLQQRRVFN